MPLPLPLKTLNRHDDQENGKAQKEQTIQQEGGSEMCLWHSSLDQVDNLLSERR